MDYICFDNQGFDLLGIEKINPELMSKEPDLYDTKWWDYRNMHPVQATNYFAASYIKAARDYWARNYDMEAGVRMKPISGWDIYHRPPPPLSEKTGKPLKSKQLKGVSKGELQGLWKARQQADLMGIPYDFYCRYAIDYAKKGLWTRIPRPTHLYSNKVSKGQADFREHSMVEYIELRWVEYKKGRTALSEAEFYRAENNTYQLDQINHRVSVMEQIKLRDKPEWGLVYALHEMPVLIESECRRYFGDQVVDRSISLAED